MKQIRVKLDWIVSKYIRCESLGTILKFSELLSRCLPSFFSLFFERGILKHGDTSDERKYISYAFAQIGLPGVKCTDEMGCASQWKNSSEDVRSPDADDISSVPSRNGYFGLVFFKVSGWLGTQKPYMLCL